MMKKFQMSLEAAKPTRWKGSASLRFLCWRPALFVGRYLKVALFILASVSCSHIANVYRKMKGSVKSQRPTETTYYFLDLHLPPFTLLLLLPSTATHEHNAPHQHPLWPHRRRSSHRQSAFNPEQPSKSPSAKVGSCKLQYSLNNLAAEMGTEIKFDSPPPKKTTPSLSRPLQTPAILLLVVSYLALSQQRTLLLQQASP